MLQILLTALVLVAALGFAGRYVWRTFRGQNDPCNGCELKKNCKKFGRSK
jgi:hypothetical protein